MTKLKISYFTIQDAAEEEVKDQSLYNTPVWLDLTHRNLWTEEMFSISFKREDLRRINQPDSRFNVRHVYYLTSGSAPHCSPFIC